MKVRIGFGLGTRTLAGDEGFGAVVDALERHHFDSLWVSERVGAEAPDPVVAMAYAAGRTTSLKFGTSVMVLPGRNPVLLAKQLASLAVMSGNRMLPAFGLGIADAHEQQAFGVARGERAAWFDEALPLLRRLWTEDAVTHHGTRFDLDDVRVLPRPSKPIDVWLGGIAPSELRRAGRMGDGWLPSFVTPADAAAGRRTVEEAADAHERVIDPEHFGALVPYVVDGPPPDSMMAVLARRRPDLDDPSVLVPTGWKALRATLEAFCAEGFSKFVVLPVSEPTAATWDDHLAEAAAELLPLQN